MQISLSLVSHTNAGKTTLARTLLGREVGTVLDESHVTETAEAYEMVRSPDGNVLLLWDTPGFGDSVRLAKRLAKSNSPINWVVGQVWDRLADRPLFSSQQALRNVREHADVVLYLVNAAEDPDSAGYVAPEMSVLTWTGKPVVALLNQMGPPRTQAQEQEEIDRWRELLSAWPAVKQVMALDAFARCWVQERVLLGTLGPLLTEPEKQDAYDGLLQAWLVQREQTFEESAQVLAKGLARAALDIEAMPDPGITGRLRDFGAQIGVSSRAANAGRDQAMIALAKRWDERERADTDELITLHGLAGSASAEVMTRIDAHFDVSEKLSEGKAAIIGGVATGALAGLKADFATGGFTLGGGMLAGSVLGAIGGAGLARGYNMIRGNDQLIIQWSDGILVNKVVSSLLIYLAVTHFGRGRGDWARSEYPEHWLEIVNTAVEKRRSGLIKTWKSRASGSKPDEAQALASALQTSIRSLLLEILQKLYPEAFGSSKPAIDAAE